MQFTRTPDVPQLSPYGKYRPYLRVDFRCRCAYCTGHEDEYGGEDSFEIDHHRPTSKFGDLEETYSNLYYSCRGCNKVGAKGEKWPSPEMQALGYRFIDPVAENAYGTHFRELTNGKLEVITPVGEYSVLHLRLNRVGLIRLRRARRTVVLVLTMELKRLEERMAQMTAEGKVPDAPILKRIQRLKESLAETPVSMMLPAWFDEAA